MNSEREKASDAALELRELDVAYRVRGQDRQVLRELSLRVERGESYGLVGESGCGKSTTALAVVRYLPRNGRVRTGTVLVDGRDVWTLGQRELRQFRANAVSMVYQNPSAALNPSLRVGRQLAEVFTVRGANRDDARARSLEMLRTVQIADPDSVLGRFPHQLSGGMQQRVVIAMALAKDPALLILDEPTTGLDATVEAEVLDLVVRLQAEFQTSVLFISHNLGVIAKMCSPRRRALRGPPRRGRTSRDRPPGSSPPVHRRAAPLRPSRRRAQGPWPTGHDPRLSSEPRRRAHRLCVR